MVKIKSLREEWLKGEPKKKEKKDSTLDKYENNRQEKTRKKE